MELSRPTTGWSTSRAAESIAGSTTKASSTGRFASRAINIAHLERGIIYGSRKTVRRFTRLIADNNELTLQRSLTMPPLDSENKPFPEETAGVYVAALNDIDQTMDSCRDVFNSKNSDKSTSLHAKICSSHEDEDERNLQANESITANEDNMTTTDTNDDAGYDTDLEVEREEKVYDHTGKTTYLAACQLERLVPAEYFLRHMKDSYLELQHRGLGNKGTKPVAMALSYNSYVNDLNLCDNWISDLGGRYICQLLMESIFITKINLSMNRFTKKFVKDMIPVLNSNSTLRLINLSGNNLTDKAAEEIADLIRSCSHLEALILSNNKLTEITALQIGSALADNPGLMHLDLSWNGIRRKGGMSIAKGLKENTNLISLNVSMNGFAVEGCRIMGEMLKVNETLEEIDLSSNRITAEGAVLLGKGIAINQRLKTLKLNSNPMQTAGCYAIIAAFLKNETSSLEALEFLDIQVNSDFLKLFEQVKERKPDFSLKKGDERLTPKMKKRLHPMIKLRNYVEKHDLRLIDFFNKFDKDGSMSVDYDEFREGMRELGIKFEEDELDFLISELDRDGDGEINYSELAIGHKNIDDDQLM